MAGDVRQWLEGLDLGRYADVFAENDVDFEVLANLTVEDLKEIGVVSVGHRRRLLDAITNLSDQPVESRLAEKLAAGRAAGVRKDRQAERRQLTVMFCDLVGSTTISQKLDPEELSEVIRAYQNTVAGEIARYEGHIAKFMGDGVMALFGYPQAHEDDPERAIRSALSVIDAMSHLKTTDGKPLQVRIGISTGDVVVGDLIGEGAAQEEAVVGDTPNLAARLQEVASAGQVAIDAATQRLASRAFTLQELKARTLKGFDATIPIWVVSGERQSQNRFEISHRGSLSDLVGRQHELGLLTERWQLAQAGEGQVVLLSGEAGIGKSRLVRALTDSIQDARPIRLNYQCAPYHTKSSLYPIIRQLERAADFTPHEADALRYAKLARLFPGDAVPFIASLFSLTPADHNNLIELTADERKERILAALRERLMTLAQEQPVLFLLEDAHWIDPTTLELLALTVPDIIDHRVLMLLTHRLEWLAPFANAPNVTRVALGQLARAQVEDLARAVAGSAADEATIGQIVERADGVPLFVEELTKSVLEAAEATSDVPESLQASLLARLDRLGPAKEIAQVAAAIGRDFSCELLAGVIEKSSSELDEALAQLLASELVFARGAAPVARYTFKHALVQDAAYGTLLMKQRRQIHGRIAEVLEKVFPTINDTEPETMAHHLTEAGHFEKAVEFWGRAARRAAGQSANIEAVDHFRMALRLLSNLPDDAKRRRMELQHQLGLGPALMAIHGWGVREAAEVYERAQALGKTEQDIDALYQATWGLWVFNQGRSAHQRARELTSELLVYAANSKDTTFTLQAHHANWTTMLFTGELAPAIEHCEAGIGLYDKAVHRGHALQYGGHDPCVCGHVQGALMYWLSGWPEQAELHSQRGLAHAEELSHRTSLVHAHMFITRYRMMRNEPRAAIDHANRLIELAGEMNLQLYKALGELWRGWATVNTGDAENGLEQMREVMTDRLGGRLRFAPPLDLAFYADALATNEDFEAALGQLAKAIDIVDRTGERFWEAELHRLQGECLWRQGHVPLGEAEKKFWQSIKVSRVLGARALELRATSSLARLMREMGLAEKAKTVLEPVYDWFTEGLNTPDLRNAKALLDELV